MFSFYKIKDELVMTQILQNKTISCCYAYNQPGVYLEPSQTSTWEYFPKNS